MRIRPIEAHSSQSTKRTIPGDSRQCQQLAAMIAILVPDWSVGRHFGELGESAIVIMPDDSDDAIYPTRIVHAEGSIFHLEELRQDTLHKPGEHWTWTELLRAVRIRPAWAMPVSATRH
jgi:hypothetical protein